MAIPTTSKWVQLDLLHPRFKKRLEKFFADKRIKGRVAVSSAARSYARQKHFYDGYRAGKKGFNLAANPDWQRPGGFFYGSFHMEQKDGFCYAVDLSNLDPKSISNSEINDIAAEYGIVATIKDREWWHHQPRNEKSWFKPTAFTESRVDTKPVPKFDLAAIVAAIHAQGESVATKPLRRRSRGPAVKTAQVRLGHLDFDAGYPDGVFGWKTTNAVRHFQRWQGLTPDGVIGPISWARLFNPVLDTA